MTHTTTGLDPVRLTVAGLLAAALALGVAMATSSDSGAAEVDTAAGAGDATTVVAGRRNP